MRPAWPLWRSGDKGGIKRLQRAMFCKRESGCGSVEVSGERERARVRADLCVVGHGASELGGGSRESRSQLGSEREREDEHRGARADEAADVTKAEVEVG